MLLLAPYGRSAAITKTTDHTPVSNISHMADRYGYQFRFRDFRGSKRISTKSLCSLCLKHIFISLSKRPSYTTENMHSSVVHSLSIFMLNGGFTLIMPQSAIKRSFFGLLPSTSTCSICFTTSYMKISITDSIKTNLS